jgi:N6-adenosine-specific RNA methylase IME4
MYDIIYADPPWLYRVWSDKGTGRSAEQHYSTMSLEALKLVPVARLANPNSVLLMWVTWPNLVEALEVGAAWGFAYKTCAFDWLKRTSTNATWHIGLGHYTRANSEPCLLFTHGKPLTRHNKGVRQLIADDNGTLLAPLVAPIARHSKKPLEAYDRIDKLWPNASKVELFARQRRVGWTSLGNEIDGKDISQAIEDLILVQDSV